MGTNNWNFGPGKSSYYEKYTDWGIIRLSQTKITMLNLDGCGNPDHSFWEL